MISNVLLSGLLVGAAAALQIPDNVKAFLTELNRSGQCNRKLASGFHNSAFEGPGSLPTLSPSNPLLDTSDGKEADTVAKTRRHVLLRRPP
jgi:hypothetical protein